MSTATKPAGIPRAVALAKATELLELLKPHSTRIAVVGSIRRGKACVGDIEILLEPQIKHRPVGLFGDLQQYTPIDSYVDMLIMDGTFNLRLNKNGRPACGERYKRLMYGQIPFDLFIVRPPAQWGVLMAIRTGPAEFSHRLVTSRLEGGYLPIGWQVKDGVIWRHSYPLETPNEQDVFDVLGIQYLPPELRA